MDEKKLDAAKRKLEEYLKLAKNAHDAASGLSMAKVVASIEERVGKANDAVSYGESAISDAKKEEKEKKVRALIAEAEELAKNGNYDGADGARAKANEAKRLLGGEPEDLNKTIEEFLARLNMLQGDIKVRALADKQVAEARPLFESAKLLESQEGKRQEAIEKANAALAILQQDPKNVQQKMELAKSIIEFIKRNEAVEKGKADAEAAKSMEVPNLVAEAEKYIQSSPPDAIEFASEAEKRIDSVKDDLQRRGYLIRIKQIKDSAEIARIDGLKSSIAEARKLSEYAKAREFLGDCRAILPSIGDKRRQNEISLQIQVIEREINDDERTSIINDVEAKIAEAEKLAVMEQYQKAINVALKEASNIIVGKSEHELAVKIQDKKKELEAREAITMAKRLFSVQQYDAAMKHAVDAVEFAKSIFDEKMRVAVLEPINRLMEDRIILILKEAEKLSSEGKNSDALRRVEAISELLKQLSQSSAGRKEILARMQQIIVKRAEEMLDAAEKMYAEGTEAKFDEALAETAQVGKMIEMMVPGDEKDALAAKIDEFIGKTRKVRIEVFRNDTVRDFFEEHVLLSKDKQEQAIEIIPLPKESEKAFKDELKKTSEDIKDSIISPLVFVETSLDESSEELDIDLVPELIEYQKIFTVALQKRISEIDNDNSIKGYTAGYLLQLSEKDMVTPELKRYYKLKRLSKALEELLKGVNDIKPKDLKSAKPRKRRKKS
jgi:hypothetical protein